MRKRRVRTIRVTQTSFCENRMSETNLKSCYEAILKTKKFPCRENLNRSSRFTENKKIEQGYY